MAESVYERVKKRAYELWEEEGRPWGRDMIHWERAHQEIAADGDTAAATRAASAVTAGKPVAKAEAPAKRTARKAV